MENELSILLIEDDPEACAEFVSLIQNNTSFTLVDVTNNSQKAVEYVRDYLPDVVILDLELHLGTGSGISFLRDYQQMHLSKEPYILVTTNNSSMTTYDYIRRQGVDFIMSKHEEDYSTEKAIAFLEMMKDIILEKRSTGRSKENAVAETPDQRKKKLMRRISAELDLVGISPKSIGYTYLTEAICEVVLEGKGNVSNKIGQRHGKTAASVERAMQNAINRAWRSEDIQTLLLHYTARIHSEKGSPTITEFIYYYAQKLKLEY